MALRLSCERFVACRIGGRDTREDPSTCSGNLLVRRTGTSHFELVGAIACEDTVGVGVDEGRRDDSLLCIDSSMVTCFLKNLRPRANRTDPTVFD